MSDKKILEEKDLVLLEGVSYEDRETRMKLEVCKLKLQNLDLQYKLMKHQEQELRSQSQAVQAEQSNWARKLEALKKKADELNKTVKDKYTLSDNWGYNPQTMEITEE